ncbi:MAG TPA: nitrate- and nitrite sensing domain-containing protein [Mycobacteriales bacterium]|nr:nitrate- and nitrite sensing domain-containing protein [Mycobacteriales bacterium]
MPSTSAPTTTPTGQTGDPIGPAPEPPAVPKGLAALKGLAARASGTVRTSSIRARLARILLLSLTIVLVLLGAMAVQQVRSFRSATSTAGTVSLALRVQDAIHQLQRERGLTNGLLGGEDRFRAQVTSTRTQTDQALAALDQRLTSRQDTDARRVRDALGRLARLPAVRADVDSGRANRGSTFGFYTDAITALNQLDLGLDRAQDPELRRGLQALYALGDAKELTGQERGFLNGVFAAGRFGAGEYLKFADIRGGKNAGLAAYVRFATADQRGRLDAALRSTAAAKADRLEAVATSSPGRLVGQVDPVDWWKQMTSVIDQMRTVQRSAGADVTARAGELRSSAARTLLAFLLLATLAVAAEVLLVVGAARSIIGPLGALAREADEVASRRLPEAVAALRGPDGEHLPTTVPATASEHADSEIRSVAHALDRVQSAALTLASEQAAIRRNTTESLANLGRRSQNLVRRQLGLISELEREELDPATLANMFELDHLATRMRRNAESLLVLVGRTSPRPSAQPLSVIDAIRAGISEVEEYRRVVLRRVDDALINGSATTEVAHMVAELIENGLSFSPPDLEVEVYGRRTGSGYLLVVVDHGVGMGPDMLARANARLRGDEDFVVAATRFLGHYVVGRLAHRLGAEVQLVPSPVTGVTARVLLPASVLTDHPVALDSVSGNAAEEALTSAEPTPAQDQQAPADPYPAGPPPSDAAQPAQPPAVRPQPLGPGQPVVTAPPYGTAHRPLRASQRQQLALGPEDVVRSPNGNGAHPAPPRQPAAALPPTGPPTGQERTRNGLVKRVPAAQRANGVPAAAHPPARAETRPTGPERSPDEVRTMLAAFRSGHARGQGQPPVPGDPAEPDRTDHDHPHDQPGGPA